MGVKICACVHCVACAPNFINANGMELYPGMLVRALEQCHARRRTPTHLYASPLDCPAEELKPHIGGYPVLAAFELPPGVLCFADDTGIIGTIVNITNLASQLSTQSRTAPTNGESAKPSRSDSGQPS